MRANYGYLNKSTNQHEDIINKFNQLDEETQVKIYAYGVDIVNHVYANKFKREGLLNTSIETFIDSLSYIEKAEFLRAIKNKKLVCEVGYTAYKHIQEKAATETQAEVIKKQDE